MVCMYVCKVCMSSMYVQFVCTTCLCMYDVICYVCMCLRLCMYVMCVGYKRMYVMNAVYVCHVWTFGMYVMCCMYAMCAYYVFVYVTLCGHVTHVSYVSNLQNV